MRKSVEKRQREQAITPSRNFWRAHWLAISIVATALLAATGFIAWTYWQEQSAAAARQAAFNQESAAIDLRIKQIRQKKIDDAKKAEAEAKARAEADAANQKNKISANPNGPHAAASSARCTVTEPASTTVILNKKHCFSPIDWAPNDLTSVDGYPLRAPAAQQLQAMRAAAASDGVPFGLSSAYRSYANQQVTYDHWVQANGSQAAADQVSARAGFSEHQTGLAVDLKVEGCALECFGSTKQYNWLVAHAAEYGFIQRYPLGLTSITGYSAESWHWRYVGPQVARDMKAKGIQTLEQYFGVNGGDYAG